MIAKIINFVLFQLAWLAAVLGAAHGMIWPSVLAALVFLAYQIWVSDCPEADLTLVGIAVLSGIVVDTVFTHSGWMTYATHWPWANVAPLWILAMWASFALVINHSVSWLKGHSLSAAAFGLIGGPLAYWAGARLGAMEFTLNHTWHALILIGVLWALVSPLLFFVALRLDRAAAAQP